MTILVLQFLHQNMGPQWKKRKKKDKLVELKERSRKDFELHVEESKKRENVIKGDVK